MKRTVKVLFVGLSAAATLAGCAGGKAGPSADATAAARDANGKPVEVQINARGKLLFEDALGLYEAQKKAKTFDYPALERKFQGAIDADKNLAEAVYNLGVLSERQGKLEQAATQYQTALRIKPSLKQAAENLAVLQQNRGDIPTAVSMYQQILEMYPDDASARARLAEVYRQNGEHDRALEFARGALMRDPKSMGAYKVMVRSYLDRKQLAIAKLVALRAQKIDESDPELYFTMGLIFLRENEPAKARLQFAKAAEVRPDYQPAQVELAKMALAAEDYVGAEEHLRKILQNNAQNAEALVNLGVAYKGQGQYDKAMQAYDAAEKVNPKLSAIYLNRGIVLLDHKGAPDRALELFKKFVQMEGGGDTVLAGDHIAFKKLKDAEAAIAAKEEEKRAVEEAARMEEATKKQQADLKAAEEKQKQAADKAGPPAPVEDPKEKGKEPPGKKLAGAKEEGKAAPGGKGVVPVKGEAPKSAATPAVAPANKGDGQNAKEPASAPSDEPTDAL